jgi:large subunit ribosomal protein L19
MNLKETYTKSMLKPEKDIPDFRAGDQVRVNVKIVEGDVEKSQYYEGTVIKFAGSGMDKTFTVRKTSFGTGVERIFPVNSPNILKIELVKRGKVRRTKLYYLRKLVGKESALKEKVSSTESAPAPKTAQNKKQNTPETKPAGTDA